MTDVLRTLLTTDMTRNIPTLLEYTIRYPGHSEMIAELINNNKLDDTVKSHNGKITSQREITTKKLFKEWKLNEDDKEFTLLIITAKTEKDKEISCIVYDDWRNGWSSMSRTTGLTACAITNLIIDKKLKKTGIITPEELGTNQNYFDYTIELVRRGGVILIDNVFWSGNVCDLSINDDDTVAIRKFNKLLSEDRRVSISIVPIGDGLTVAYKL